MTLAKPLSGTIFHWQAGLAMVNLCTKFEVSNTKGGAKWRKWGGSAG